MTVDKVADILSNQYGISNPLDNWISLMPQIGVISLAQDGNIFVSNQEKFYFDSETELMEIRKFYSETKYVDEGKLDINRIVGFFGSTQRAN